MVSRPAPGMAVEPRKQRPAQSAPLSGTNGTGWWVCGEFLDIFMALGFSRFDGEPTPSQYAIIGRIVLCDETNMTDTGKTTLSPNSAIDAAIREILPNFSDESQGRMRKAILNAKKAAEKHRDENSDAGARHVFREFIPASILNQNGFCLEYEKLIQGRKPDWLDDSARLMLDAYTYERGGTSSLLDRLASSVTDKCNKYKDIIASNSLRFMVAVYLDFLTGVLLDECREDAELFRSVFDANNSLWAILFFTETHFVGRTQHYGFFCLCVDSSFESFPNWPFDTIKLNP
jgi:hypothetical protein